MLKKLSKSVATLGGIGYLPKAPGTWGSVTGALVWYGLGELINDFHNYQLPLIVIAIIAGIISSGVLSRGGNKDPQEVVIDELAGTWIALLWLPHSIKLTVLALILFRIFDIAKPFGIRKLEALKGGFGVMADDIAAGCLTAVIIHIGIRII